MDNIDNINNNSTTNSTEYEFDEFEEEVVNYTYAILTPKNGYDNIFAFLGGISDVANKYFDLFKGNSTPIQKKIKIVGLSGKMRIVKFIEMFGYSGSCQGWFNVDGYGNLLCDNCSDLYDEAKESLNLILDTIDQIAQNEKMSYDKIFLGGFSQGGIMTNYV